MQKMNLWSSPGGQSGSRHLGNKYQPRGAAEPGGVNWGSSVAGRITLQRS